MSETVQNIVIGFGKAGKTLAGFMAKKGEKTILIEQSPTMYGGTCINVGCIPSKTLATKANRKIDSSELPESYYETSMHQKNQLIATLNKANYDKIAQTGVEIIDGTAYFVDPHTVEVEMTTGTKQFTAERIFINTGARPFVPPVEGLTISERILTSDALLSLATLPKKLVIIGSGFIGLEFAATYAQFGSHVTVLDSATEFLPNVEPEVAQAIWNQFESMGVSIQMGVQLQRVEEGAEHVDVYYEHETQPLHLTTDIVLVATGRTPNSASLRLEKADIAVSERGAIQVNDYLQTSQPHIFALGDVNGGPQFTYISLDDFRIVKEFLYGEKRYSTAQRRLIPTSAFIHPTLSQVGLTEVAAKQAGYTVVTATLPVPAIPKAKILNHQVGLYKVVVDASNGMILGATLYGEESHEVINIITTAMLANLPYTALRDQIFTHPTMAEALNDVFTLIQL